MSRYVDVYGFGSYFRGEGDYGDIDILVLHSDTSEESIEDAIECKKALVGTIRSAHVIMLSVAEENEMSFVERSGAIFLASIECGRTKKGVGVDSGKKRG